MEDHALGAGEHRGAGGPAGRDAASASICARRRHARGRTVASGLPVREDINHPEQEGIAYITYNIARGRRQSSAAAFLTPAVRRRAEPDDRHRRTGAADRHARHARDRSRRRARREDQDVRCESRSHRQCRCAQLAEAAALVGHRAGRSPALAWHRRARRQSRRRPEHERAPAHLAAVLAQGLAPLRQSLVRRPAARLEHACVTCCSARACWPPVPAILRPSSRLVPASTARTRRSTSTRTRSTSIRRPWVSTRAPACRCTRTGCGPRVAARSWHARRTLTIRRSSIRTTLRRRAIARRLSGRSALPVA